VFEGATQLRLSAVSVHMCSQCHSFVQVESPVELETMTAKELARYFQLVRFCTVWCSTVLGSACLLACILGTERTAVHASSTDSQTHALPNDGCKLARRARSASSWLRKRAR
jgi:hypothetical protein